MYITSTVSYAFSLTVSLPMANATVRTKWVTVATFRTVVSFVTPQNAFDLVCSHCHMTVKLDHTLQHLLYGNKEIPTPIGHNIHQLLQYTR